MYFGYGVMGLYPGKSKVETSIAVWGWTNYLGAESIKIKTSSIMRIHPKTADTKVKITGYYINSIMASLEVRSLGYNEALLLDYEGNVAEGPGENIFMVKDGRLITPKEDNILPGLTRDSIFRIAKDNDIEIVEKALSLEELKDADEAFLTGTAVEVAPIKQIDETNIGNGEIGPITQKLKSIYTGAIHGKIETYNDWLTYV
jgi:branched-chain amino acid aminotransferase